MKKAAMFSVMIIFIMLGSCEINSPYIDVINDKITSDTSVTISGRVYDTVTGAPVPEAEIGFGEYKTTSDTDGTYSFIVPKGSSIKGTFYASAGNTHNFIVFTEMDIRPESDTVYDIPLYPADTSILPTHQLSGTVDSFDFNSITTISFIIHNENGGVSYCSYTTDGVTDTYTINSPTFGTDCIVEIYVDTQFYYYVTGIDMSAPSTTFNFVKPAAGYSDINISGTVNNEYGAYMEYAPGVILNIVPNRTLVAAPDTIPVYNPENKPVYWYSYILEADTPEATYSTGKSVYSDPAVLGTSITLPSTSIQGPSTVASTASISYINGELSFTGTSEYFTIYFNPDESNMGGNVITASSSITFPESIDAILTSSVDTSTLWDVGLSSSYVSPGYTLEMILKNFPPPGYSFADVYAGSKADVIP